jgi:hypothetical protein
MLHTTKGPVTSQRADSKRPPQYSISAPDRNHRSLIKKETRATCL